MSDMSSHSENITSEVGVNRWNTLDPVTQHEEWLNLGLQLGTNAADAAQKEIQNNRVKRFAAGIFKLIAKLSSIGKPANEHLVINPYQRPWLGLWPKLNGRPFPDASALSNCELVQAEWKSIFEELEALNSSENNGFERAVYDGFDGIPWKTCYFNLFGQRNTKLHELCPKTSAMLELLPGNKVHTCFSRIDSGASLPPHVGPSNAWLIGHLGLLNCEDTHIFSGAESKNFKQGEWLILDDSFIHGVVNRGTKPRYTLMVTFYHPELNAFEVLVLKTIIKTVAILLAPLFEKDKIALRS